MGIIIAIPIVLLFGTLLVFFPIIISIIFTSLMLMLLIYIKWANANAARELINYCLLDISTAALPDPQIKLINRYALYFRFYFAVGTIVGMLAFFQWFAVPMAIIVSLKGQWYLIPFAVVVWVVCAFTSASIDLEALVNNRLRKAHDPMAQYEATKFASVVKQTYEMINRTESSSNRVNGDPEKSSK